MWHAVARAATILFAHAPAHLVLSEQADVRVRKRMSHPALDPRALPELTDIHAWLGAPEPRQREVLQAVSAALGPDFETVYGDPDPRTRAGHDADTFAYVSLQGGLRIEHLPSGLLLCLVPGGTTAIGLSDPELAAFDEPELLLSLIHI